MKLMWIWLFLKRLLKKPTYLALLILIPLTVALFHGVTGEPAGMVTVLLAQEAQSDPVSSELIDQLLQRPGVIRFVHTTVEEATRQVSCGKADAAWIFPEDTEKCLQAYAAGEPSSGHFIRVLEQEQTIPLRLARERLNAVIYSQTVRQVFVQTAHRLVPQTQDADDLTDYLEQTHVTGELFEFADVQGNPQQSSGNYLIAPIRGMLAVITLLCALVTGIYYRQDERNGLFALIPTGYRAGVEAGYHLLSTVSILAVCVVALGISGLVTSAGAECLLFALYAVGCALFAMVLGGLAADHLAASLPVLSAVLLVVCPVFLDIPGIRPAQYLLPPTYYILGAADRRWILALALYDVALAGLWVAVRAIRKNKWSKLKIK